MSKPPNCRELLDRLNDYAAATDDDVDALVSRVEKVLALHSRKTSSGSCAHCLDGHSELACQTVRLLDGEEP